MPSRAPTGPPSLPVPAAVMFKTSRSESPSSVASSWNHVHYDEIPQTPNKEVEFMPRPSVGTLLISPFGHKNGLRDGDLNLENLTSSPDDTSSDETEQEWSDSPANAEADRPLATSDARRVESGESDILDGHVPQTKHGLMRDFAIASCEALVMTACFKGLTCPPSTLPLLQSVTANAIAYLAAITVTNSLFEARNVPEREDNRYAKSRRIRTLLALPVTSSLYQMGRLVGYLGRSFVEGVKDGYMA